MDKVQIYANDHWQYVSIIFQGSIISRDTLTTTIHPHLAVDGSRLDECRKAFPEYRFRVLS